ncbi:MAG: DUF4062 domain-containing protein [Planctomycetaceae bacterium]|nr:DUF4062 domain-containing protein [Planctomycetaceae bacterium]
MINDLKGMRIFLGSPSEDLKEERNRFQYTVCKYNSRICNSKKVFLPVLWEYTSGGHGEPQGQINMHLDLCDYAVFVFWKTLGSHNDDPNFESATIREYRRSISLLSQKKLLGVVVCFKQIPSELTQDPGVELKKVLDFKVSIKDECKYIDFVNVDSFEVKIQDQLIDWLNPQAGIQNVGDIQTF